MLPCALGYSFLSSLLCYVLIWCCWACCWRPAPAPLPPRLPTPQNPAVSDAQGHPRDSTTFYFPAADSSYIPADPSIAAAESAPPYRLRFASCNLFHFGAPVLANYYLGSTTYRFLWLRSFHRPVLLTLTWQASGATLRTQLLSKPACGPKAASIRFIPPNASPAQIRKMELAFQKRLADPAVQQEIAEANRPPVQVISEETTRPVAPQQWQRFEQLLRESGFETSPAYSESWVNDGAYWLLEAHQPGNYHFVFSHSPAKQDGFRKACEYLIELSSVRGEVRY